MEAGRAHQWTADKADLDGPALGFAEGYTSADMRAVAPKLSRRRLLKTETVPSEACLESAVVETSTERGLERDNHLHRRPSHLPLHPPH